MLQTDAECSTKWESESQTHLPRYDLFIDLNGLVSKERRVPCCHLIYEYTQRPPVYCLVIPLVDINRGITRKEGRGREKKRQHYWQFIKIVFKVYCLALLNCIHPIVQFNCILFFQQSEHLISRFRGKRYDCCRQQVTGSNDLVKIFLWYYIKDENHSRTFYREQTAVYQ